MSEAEHAPALRSDRRPTAIAAHHLSETEEERRRDMGTMSIGHWLIVLVVVLLVFGPKRLGDVGKGLGQGLRGLREGLSNKDPDQPADGADKERSADKVESK
jgi:sec-independent protein translocase protein TatA